MDDENRAPNFFSAAVVVGVGVAYTVVTAIFSLSLSIKLTVCACKTKKMCALQTFGICGTGRER